MTSLAETARLFLWLGTTAFGGPAAHIALMEAEVVGRRGWMSRQQFLDAVGVTALIPGPNSTELAMLVGLARHGRLGILVAGACFIAPAATLVAVLAWAYVRYGSLPEVAGMLAAIAPVVLAIILRAIWQLGRVALKSVRLAATFALAIAAAAAGVNELAVLVGAAILQAAITPSAWTAMAVLCVTRVEAWREAAAVEPVSLWTMAVVFAKIGAVLYGSGYVLIAFLRADFVDRLGWITERQLLDAVAVGQVTPGPLFTTATFIGYLLGGPLGAAVATAAIFLPGFVFVALSGPLVAGLRRSPLAGAALDGVNAGSLALMAVVTWQLASTTLTSPLTIGLFIGSVALLAIGTGATWLVAAAAVLGFVSRVVG